MLLRDRVFLTALLVLLVVLLLALLLLVLLLLVLLLLVLLLLLLPVLLRRHILLLLPLAAFKDSRCLSKYAGGGGGILTRGATSYCNILFDTDEQLPVEYRRVALCFAAAASAIALRSSIIALYASLPVLQ